MSTHSLNTVSLPITVPVDFPNILRDLNRAILKEQPTDIIQFCSNYFKTLMEQQSGIPTLIPALNARDEATDGSTNLVDKHEPLSDDDEDYEEPGSMPLIVNHNRGRRTSVSAESMAPSTANEVYVKVVINKTVEQRQRIEAAIRANFLFKSIDEEQFTDVINAMAEKSVANGETIITQGGIGDYFYVVETGTRKLNIRSIRRIRF